MTSSADALLKVENLSVEFHTDRNEGVVSAVDEISFEIGEGESLGVVGESGSGKSVTFLSTLGLVPCPPGLITGDGVWFDGRNLLGMPEASLRRIRGSEISMVFQDPTSSLNPVYPIGSQIVEAILLHNRQIDRGRAGKRAIELLESVGIPEPKRRAREYPHQFSGGMRQRAMIAMAIANQPKLLLADEPTTALDVTVEAQIMDLFQQLREQTESALVLISHDLALIAERVDRVLVMYGGRIVEEASVRALYRRPAHPYTQGLLSVVPRADKDVTALPAIPGTPPSGSNLPSGCRFHPRCALMKGRDRCRTEVPSIRTIGGGRRVACHFAEELFEGEEPLFASTRETSSATVVHSSPQTVGRDGEQSSGITLEVSGLTKRFSVGKGGERYGQTLLAVNDVSFQIRAGETLGLVGESGCGKTTTGRCIVRLLRPDSGDIVLNGRSIATASTKRLRPVRREMQYIFQDPSTSLNPRMSVREILEEPLHVHQQGENAAERTARADEMLEYVGLLPEHRERYPHEFSGGQAQRIAIARALMLRPSLLILDEPVSALDVSIQAQIVNLLKRLQDELGLAYMFIAHDLGVVRHLSDQVAVMYLGRIVEMGETARVFDTPQHPYTVSLLDAIPAVEEGEDRPRRKALRGEVPSPVSPPQGCHFHPRCWKAESRCSEETPPLAVNKGLVDPLRGRPQSVACFYPEGLDREPLSTSQDG